MVRIEQQKHTCPTQNPLSEPHLQQSYHRIHRPMHDASLYATVRAGFRNVPNMLTFIILYTTLHYTRPPIVHQQRHVRQQEQEILKQSLRKCVV